MLNDQLINQLILWAWIESFSGNTFSMCKIFFYISMEMSSVLKNLTSFGPVGIQKCSYGSYGF